MNKIFQDRLTTGARSSTRAWLISLLIVGCVLPGVETDNRSLAQEVHPPGVAQSNRETSYRNEPLMTKLANIFKKSRHEQRHVQATEQQRFRPNVPNGHAAIRQATFLQDAGPNGYQALPNAPPNEPNYQRQQAWQYPNGGFPSNQLPPYFPGQLSPGYYDQPMSGGQNSRSTIQYNGAGQNNHQPRRDRADYKPDHGTWNRAPAQSHNPRGADYEFGKTYEAGRDSGYDMSTDQNLAGRGRGHFANGPTIHGSNLHPMMKTATEFANELKGANEKLWERIDRSEKQLESKDAELRQAYDLADSKDRELQQSRTHISELKSEVSRMKAMLLIAQQENQKLRDQTEQTLKEIETTLDEELFRSFSRRGD